MSHFKVAVITHGKTVEELMAPYQENNMGNVPRKFLKFYRADKDERDEDENAVAVFDEHTGEKHLWRGTPAGRI